MPWSRRFDCLLPLALLALVQRVIKMIPPLPELPKHKGRGAGRAQPGLRRDLRGEDGDRDGDGEGGGNTVKQKKIDPISPKLERRRYSI